MFLHCRPLITEEEARQIIAALSTVQLPNDDETTSSIWKSPITTIGLNATLRLLNKDTDVNVLIISASIRPKHIVDQILMLALRQHSSIRILCVPRLNELLTESIGFSSCLCFSLSGDLTHPSLQGLLQLVNTLASRFTTPSSYLRPTPNEAKSDNPQDDGPLKAKRQLSPICFERIYLEKPVAGRSFVPEGTVFQSKPTNDWSEFISFGTADKSVTKRSLNTGKHQSGSQKGKPHFKKHSTTNDHKFKANYINLSVNRVQGNPNKVKKFKKK